MKPRGRAKENAARSLCSLYKNELMSLCRVQGCVVCNKTKEEENRSLWWFLKENYGEPPWIERLMASGGFCSRHALRLTRPEAAWPVGYVYSYLIAHDCRAIKEVLDRIPGLAGPSGVSRPLVAWLEDKTLKGIKETLASGPNDTTPLRDAPTLCMRHLRRATEILPLSISSILLASHLKMLTTLGIELEEYRRKEDYRFKHEPEGSEQTAWLRATQLYAGSFS